MSSEQIGPTRARRVQRLYHSTFVLLCVHPYHLWLFTSLHDLEIDPLHNRPPAVLPGSVSDYKLEVIVTRFKQRIEFYQPRGNYA
jgi:hypothetical protein